MVSSPPAPDVDVVTPAVTTSGEIGLATDDACIVDIHSDASPPRASRDMGLVLVADTASCIDGQSCIAHR